jgi:DNA-binding XRE family transcriptional regulator
MDDSAQHVKLPQGNGALTPEPRKLPKRRGFPVAIDARALRSRRRAALLTQAQVADLAGISIAYMCMLESGRYGHKPGIDIVRALAGILGCEESDLRQDEAA